MDAGNAVVANAEATLTNTATGLNLQGTSNNLGLIVFPSLQAGVYTLTVSAPGFQKYVRTGIDLTAGETRDARWR